MTDHRKLVAIKSLHTLIWVGFNICFAVAIWAGLNGRFDALFWVPVGLVGVECLIIVFNDWTCPLTPIAARYTDDRRDNFDIYLPLWLARHNKTIYTAILVVGAIAILLKNFGS